MLAKSMVRNAAHFQHQLSVKYITFKSTELFCMQQFCALSGVTVICLGEESKEGPVVPVNVKMCFKILSSVDVYHMLLILPNDTNSVLLYRELVYGPYIASQDTETIPLQK